ncbi:cysteine desulfurase-like protein [Candidatus Roseilinea sp. NK_OTU-006]|jgi:cysteine desulfurase family protein (TIGR01976 family)|nr:cysteine desulfurase-like protein [Candidatus Roseilinea sp. NK_OTU-006]
MFNLSAVRSEFPALAREHAGRPLIFFDAPGGTQVTRRCLDYIVEYLTRHNANTHGAFITAQESDALIEAAHEAAADLLNAERKEEIVFGQNMTSLTFALSRSIGRTLREGDEIILTRLDHDANFSPWRLMAEERGARVHVVDIHPEDCTLVMEDFARYLNARTRLVAVGYVSNAVGTINPVKQIAAVAHAVGAWVFVDAVAAAPHLPIDVRDLGADFLVCSTYKFWGPHQGILYGKYDLLDRLPAYKVRPADDRPPHKFETGTQSHENQAGLLGVIEYLEWLAAQADVAPEPNANLRSPRAAEIHRAMYAVRTYETGLVSYLIECVTAIPGVRFFGIRERMDQRVPTIAIRYKDEHPRATAERLARHGICVWDGNYYAINLTERLGVEDGGGLVRIGLTHYNTREEVDRLLDVLAQ